MTDHFQDVGRASLHHSEQLGAESPWTYSAWGQPGFYRDFGKRAFDLAFVILVAPVALLLIGIAALVTMLLGYKPFYFQNRVGRGGRVFRLLKIRTMVPDAEARLEDYLRRHPSARQEWEDKQKLTNDPRITWSGKFLRQTSLDELPQLWNVFRGDMSIVGPRPMMVEQRKLYPGQAYYAMRPGITGFWQISARNDCSFATRAVFDSQYGETLSLKTDMYILLRTVGVVLRCTGH